jgi:mycobactin polyketide synthetase MbtD
MSPADALAVGMNRFRENAIVLAFDFDRARPVLEAYGYGPLVSQLTSPVIETQAPAEKTDISRRLLSLLAEAIGVARAETIDTSVPMVAIGLDSLQALELRRRIKIEFDHDLEVSDLLGGASISDVLAQLSGWPDRMPLR